MERQPRAAQFPDELGRIDDIGRVSCKRDQHLGLRGEPAADMADKVKRMKCNHHHADHVFPEEGIREQISAKHDLFPDRAGDHDDIERDCLGKNGQGCGLIAIARPEIMNDKRKADQEHQKLEWRENALHQRPYSRIAPHALLRRVERTRLVLIPCRMHVPPLLSMNRNVRPVHQSVPKTLVGLLESRTL
jgi:hypothetical protein